MDIQLIDLDVNNRIFFVLKAKKLKGVSKLVQIVVLSLLNVPGGDVFDPEKGGGIPSMVSLNIDPNDSTEIFGEIAQRVKKSKTEIITDQIGLDDAPEEKLSDIQIISIENGEDIDEVFVRLRVLNEAGQATDIVV